MAWGTELMNCLLNACAMSLWVVLVLLPNEMVLFGYGGGFLFFSRLMVVQRR